VQLLDSLARMRGALGSYQAHAELPALAAVLTDPAHPLSTASLDRMTDRVALLSEYAGFVQQQQRAVRPV
jgi:hypothetical protein